MSRDVAASIKARLLAVARERGEQFEWLLVHYAFERMLYRLGSSSARDRFVLKGARMLTLWMKDSHRATRDMDLLALGRADQASIQADLLGVLAVPCPGDGLSFDLPSFEVGAVESGGDYPGYRAHVRARLGTADIRLHIDLGTGDVVTPAPEDVDYPTVLGHLPAPHVRAYPMVSSVAEKLEAMVDLGRRNSRMKDFHDIWALSSLCPFQGALLREAVSRCFQRRGTLLGPDVPEVLELSFYSDRQLQTHWRNYTRSDQSGTPPPDDFVAVGERIRAFLGPVRESIVAGEGFEHQWPAGGPWE